MRACIFCRGLFDIFRNQLAADRTYVRGTMVDKEPVLRTKNGRSFAFSPEWYTDLVKMCNASLDMLGFGPEMVLALATEIVRIITEVQRVGGGGEKVA